jgi:hypothetical protein
MLSKGTGWGYQKLYNLHGFYNITSHIRSISLAIWLGMIAGGSRSIWQADMLVLASTSRKSASFAIEKRQLDRWFATSMW